MLSVRLEYDPCTPSSATGANMSKSNSHYPGPASDRRSPGGGRAAVIWSTAGIFTKSVSADIWTILFWRGVFSTLFILVYLVWKQGRSVVSDAGKLGVPGWALATVGAAATVCFIASFKNTSIANVGIIYATVPFMAAVLGLAVDARDADPGHRHRRHRQRLPVSARHRRGDRLVHPNLFGRRSGAADDPWHGAGRGADSANTRICRW